MQNEAIAEFQPPGTFVKFLTECGLKRIGPVDVVGEFEVHYLDLMSFKLMAGHHVPFVISRHLSGYKTIQSDKLEQVVDDLLQTMRNVNPDFFVLTVGGRVDELTEDLREKMRLQSVALLDGRAIETIMPERNNKDRRDDRNDKHRRECALVQGIAAWLGRTALSPYKSGSPASGERFFGREEEVKIAMATRRGAGNFTFMGSRRIGKTSLLREIRRRIEAHDPESRIADIYASTYKSTLQVLSAILSQVFRQTEADRFMQDPAIAQKFPQVIQSAARDRKTQIAVFVDELDELLELDLGSGGELMKILRATFQGQDSCRIFFAGFRRVMAEATQQKSELFNFTNKIRLRGLSRDETREMIEIPLTLLGVDVHDDHVAMLYQETKGHPELLQIYCSTLLSMWEKMGRTPDSNELATVVLNSEPFRQRIYGTFMSNANAFEELLTYLFVAEMRNQGQTVDDFVFSLPEADEALTKVNVELDTADIEGLLTNLSMISITEEIDGRSGYRFAFPALISYIESRNLEFLTRKALATLNRNLASPQALWSEGSKP